MVNYKTQIQAYNPYVQQIPTDAYVKVGMAMQQAEEAGIQRIQSTIDTVAGLDIANIGGKKHLNDRVNELTTSLNGYGYGNFANQDNVRAMQSLAAPIYQDMNIVTDVANTIQYRQLQKDQAEALKSGNAEQFSVAYENMTKVMPWLNSKTAGENYSAGSNTLRGTVDQVRKKFEDSFNKFTADSTAIKNEKGEYWIKETNKWMDPDRLKRYVMTQMDGNDVELLKRSGWSKYGNLDENTLKSATIGLYDQLKSKENIKVSEANKELGLYTPGSSNWKGAKDKVDYYTQSRDSYDKLIAQVANTKNLSDTDKESLYQILETNTFADGLANAWAYTDVSRDIEINKLWEYKTTLNSTNLNNQLNRDNAITTAGIGKGQLIVKETKADGRPNVVVNPDWSQYKDGEDGSSGSGTGSGGTKKAGANPTDETLTVGIATDKTVTEVNFESIDGVINNLNNQELEFDRQVNEFLYQSGFEDLFVGRAADFNGSGVTDKKSLVVTKGKEQLHQYVLNKLTDIVQRVAKGEDMSKAPETQPGYDANAEEKDRYYQANFKKSQLDSYLNDPELVKIVQKRSEMNLTRDNFGSVIKEQAMKTASTKEERDRISKLNTSQVLDYWNNAEVEAHSKDQYSTNKRGTDTHSSQHAYFSEDHVKRINAELKNISTANQNRIITAFSDLQVKNNGQLVSIQSALFNKMFPANEEESQAIDPTTIKITGANINRGVGGLDKYDGYLTVSYRKGATDDNKGMDVVRKVQVKDIIENNDDNNKIRNLFRIAEFGTEDLAARYAAGINDNTLDKDGNPDLSKYMILTSQNKDARYFRIRTMAQDPALSQKQLGDISGQGRTVASTTTTGNTTKTTYQTNNDLTGGNSFLPGKSYIEELIYVDGKPKRVIVRQANSDKFFEFPTYSNARLYLKDIYENSPYWSQYHEDRFIKK